MKRLWIIALLFWLVVIATMCFAQNDSWNPIKCGEHKHIDLDRSWKDCEPAGPRGDWKCTVTGKCVDDLMGHSPYSIIQLDDLTNREIYFVIPGAAKCSPPMAAEMGMKTLHCWMGKP